ncbi:MAG: trigger factor [Bacteroidia bacterium]
MNVTLEKKDDLNALISIHIDKADYESTLDQQLKDYRKKANLPGFRPGQVPLGMVKKMVGKSLLYEEVNKITSDKLYGYLKENNIDILGQPMSSAEKESELDFDTYGDFTFHFDLGLAPEVKINISEKDKLTRFDIQLDEKEVETEIKNLRRQQGSIENVEVSETENDSIVALMTELDKDGSHKDGGVFEQEVTVLPEIIKDKKLKKQLVGVKAGDEIKLSPSKLFNDNDMVIKQSLAIEEDQIKILSKDFNFKVKEIRRVIPAELNQEFYNQVFGPDVVTNEEDFKKKIEENLGLYYKSEAEKQLESEVNQLLQNKHQLQLPDEFLKRWLVETKPETYTSENIEEKYEEESKILRKQLIREKIADDAKLEVSGEDLDETSYAYTAQLLRQYGLNNPDPQMIQNFEAKNREDEGYMLRIRDVVVEKKVLDHVKTQLSIKSKKTTVEKFYDEVKRYTEKHNN